MMRTTIVAVALVVAGAAAAEPCKIPRVAETKIEQQGGAISIEASIRGEPIPMVIDTGAWASSIAKATAEKLGIEVRQDHRVRAHGVGGELKVGIVTVSDVVIGNGHLREWTLHVFEGMRSDARQIPFGLLGLDLLGSFDLEFDLQGRRFALYAKSDCAKSPPWPGGFSTVSLQFARDDRIRFPVEIDGRTLIAELDSGASRTFLTWPAARKLGIAKDTPGVERAGDAYGADGKARATYQYRFQSFDVGGEVLKHPRLRISEVVDEISPNFYRGGAQAQVTAELPTDLFLGADWLRAHRVYVGREVGEMHFTYLSGPIFEK